MRLWYLPLEPYKERYTALMSCPDGWAESWIKASLIDAVVVRGIQQADHIGVGSVLDGYARGRWAMSQAASMLDHIQRGDVKDDDVIYTEDFWHPGIEALFYVRELTHAKWKIGCFIHAQTVDDTDFTFPMARWMRPMEIGMSYAYDYIFTASPILKQLAEEAGYAQGRIHVVGLPFHSQRLKEQVSSMFNGAFATDRKDPFVLFSSRFDSEKNPHFFLDLVEACPDVAFVLVKPRQHISNDQSVIAHLDRVLNENVNLRVVDTSDKKVYYDLLSRAKVQFNCAFQDWVSWTLLEAVAFGCNPLYPNWKDFPRELAGWENEHIYEPWKIGDAAKKLHVLLDKPFDPDMEVIIERHDGTWRKMLSIMNFL